jgi:hypothetical protein
LHRALDVAILNAMKIAVALRIVLVGIFSAVLCACATYPRSGSEAVAGIWTNALGTVWTLNSNGSFEVDLNHDGKRDAWGNYTVKGDTITIMGTGGTVPKDCKGNGVYRFNRERNTLRFTRISDRCQLRVRNVMLVWHRK